MTRLDFLSFIEDKAQCALITTPRAEAVQSIGLWPLLADRPWTHQSIGKSKPIDVKTFAEMKTAIWTTADFD